VKAILDIRTKLSISWSRSSALVSGQREGEHDGNHTGTSRAFCSPWLTADPVGAEYPVALCDLGIFADQATEPVPSQNPDIRTYKGWMVTPSGRALTERPVRTMNVIVLDVLAQD
jgi:hypothetical protein